MADYELSGKIALVTGASSGIGRSTAIALAREGARVAILGRDAVRLQETASHLDPGKVLAIPSDLTSEEGCRAAVDRTIAHWGGLDILVNAAGIIGFGTIENESLEQWDRMLNINLRSIFILMQLAVPHLIERKGAVVNVSSVTGVRSFPGVLSYCVSKAGVDQLTRCAALELAPKGVRVNAVNPGVVVTQLHRNTGMVEEAYQQFLERSKTTHPLGRTGLPEEIADLILFLASPRSGWITGMTCAVDGGRHLTCAR
jgi:NAD(P)-dependent dehydrogenase (short-subunit alcohol dehydrogenase family)